MLPEERISYSSCSVISDNLYNDIKNKSEISKYIIGLQLEMRHIINNIKNKSIILTRLLDETKQFKKMFSNMMESSNIILNGPTKIHHKQSNKKKIVVESKKNDKNLYDTLKRKKKTCGFCAVSGYITTGCST